MKKGSGCKTPKMKDGGSFPDLNKDGKVTQADILMGRGVVDSPAKKYKSDAQRKAVHASKAEQSALKNYKKGYYGA